MSIRVWTCRNFRGHYAVGAAAVVVARDLAEAERLLRLELVKIHPENATLPLTLVPLDDIPAARVLHDGNY